MAHLHTPADLWGRCCECSRWFPLDVIPGSSWDCPHCACEPKDIVNRAFVA